MKVLYIVGVGRSGSTLLERMLGAVPGSVNAGELNAIFSRVATQDQRCGCGEPFSACAFWTAVGERGVRRLGRGDRADGAPAAARWSGSGTCPGWSPGVAGAAYRRELDEYLDVHHRLYRAISAVSGAEVVVDASKSTAQLFALRRIEGLDLRVLNLVRDSRGVANSWNKSGIRKPQSADGDADGDLRPAPAGRALGRAPAGVRRARARPRRTRPGCATRTSSPDPGPRSSGPCASVGLPPADGALAHVGERSVNLEPQPRGRGQPDPVHRRSHRAAARRRLALDACPRGARRVVTAVTLPQLVGYGYVGRRPRAAHGRGRVMAVDRRGASLARPAPRRTPGPRFLKPGWPLAVLYLGFPLWWALGPRPADLLRDGGRDGRHPAPAGAPPRARAASPSGCCSWSGCWPASSSSGPTRPGPCPGGGIGRLAGFTVWAGWYVAITIAMLYVANTARQVSDPADRAAARLDVRGHDRLRRAGRAGPDAGVPVADGAGAPAAADVDELRPHAGPPVAVVVQRLPRATCSRGRRRRSPTRTPGATTSPSTCPFFILAWFGRDARLAPEGGPGRAGRRHLPDHLLAQPRAVDLAGARRRLRRRPPRRQRPRPGPPGPGRRRARRRHRVRVLAALRHPRPAGRDPAQQRPPRRHRGDGRLGHRRGVAARRLRHHPHHAGQLQLAGRRRDRGVPPVRCAAARDPGLHVAAGPDHRVRRHRAVPVVLRLPVPAPGARARRRWTWRPARCCSSRCSASSSTTPSARRCSPR